MAQQVATVDMPQFRAQLNRMGPQFEAVLKAAGIETDAFLRVILTAVQNNPNLLKYDIRSLLSSAMKAAEDGLLPDGKEGAFVPFKGRVQWIPMIAGYRKKVFESGLIRKWDLLDVHEGDDFHWEEGMKQIVMHIPRGNQLRTDNITHVYSRVEFKDGSIGCKVMSIGEVEQIKERFSRAQDGPWADVMTKGEMRKKTVGRAHFKMLPTNKNIERLWGRMDEVQGVGVNEDDHEAATRRRVAATSIELLDNFASVQDAPYDEDSAKGTGTELPPKTNIRDKTQDKPSDKAERTVDDMAANYLKGALEMVAEMQTYEDLNNWAESEKSKRGALPKEMKQTLLDAMARKSTELKNAEG